MSEDFKLPASSYEEIIKIINAYGLADKQVSISELNQICGIATTTISRNSGFLLATNIIEGGKAKKITETGKKLAKALEYEVEEQISNIWREIVVENNFLSKMISAIKIRRGMDVQSFLSHIAYSSGQNKTKYVKTGSATVLDILKTSGLVKEVDGKLLATVEVHNKGDLEVVENSPITHPKGETSGVQKGGTFTTKLQNDLISINIDIKVEAKVSELDELGGKLNKLLNQIKRKDSVGEKE